MAGGLLMWRTPSSLRRTTGGPATAVPILAMTDDLEPTLPSVDDAPVVEPDPEPASHDDADQSEELPDEPE